MTTTSAGGRRSRRKGHQFERDIAIDLRPIYPTARRHLENHELDANGVDILGTGNFRFQCKKLKKYAPIERIFEIQHTGREIPVLVTAGDGKPAMAVLPWVQFLRMLGLVVEPENFY